MNYFEEIEKYHYQQMSAEEMEAFEKKLDSDNELAREMALYCELDEYIQSIVNEEEFSTRIKSVIQGHHPLPAATTKATGVKDPEFYESHDTFSSRDESFPPMWLKIAASVVLIVSAALAFWLHSQRQPHTGEQLFAKFYQPYAIEVALRSDAIPDEDLLTKALDAFNKGKFTMAASFFESLYQQTHHSGRENLRFFIGISYIEAGEFEKAKRALSGPALERDNLFYLEAKWYLGLIYLRTDNKDMARETFEQLSREGWPDQQELEDILSRI